MGTHSACNVTDFLLDRFTRICDKFSNKADFLLVYIEEAHPDERGHIRDNYKIVTHKTLESRLDAANVLVKELDDDPPCPVVVDTMTNEANYAYGALPERLYILKDDKVLYEGAKGPFGHDVSEMESRLKEILQ